MLYLPRCFRLGRPARGEHAEPIAVEQPQQPGRSIRAKASARSRGVPPSCCAIDPLGAFA